MLFTAESNDPPKVATLSSWQLWTCSLACYIRLLPLHRKDLGSILTHRWVPDIRVRKKEAVVGDLNYHILLTLCATFEQARIWRLFENSRGFYVDKLRAVTSSEVLVLINSRGGCFHLWLDKNNRKLFAHFNEDLSKTAFVLQWVK